MPYQDRDLRRWLIGGGVSLAAIAGYVNAVLLTYYHVPVSHMSGAASRLAIDAASGQIADLRFVALLVLGFFGGSVFSGALLEAAELQPGRRYGIVLMLEGLVLATAAVLATARQPAAVPVAAMACGLQNAMASTYYGLILRTTHVTGIVTDLGVMVGRAFRGQRPEGWRATTLGGVLVGFVVGGWLGVAAAAQVGMPALWGPAAACSASGFTYWLWRRFSEGDGDAAD